MNTDCKLATGIPVTVTRGLMTFKLPQGSYRNLTVVFQTFPGQNYFFSGLFKAFCEQNITKLAFKR